MGKHPPLSPASEALENTRPLVGAMSTSTARSSAPASHSISQNHSTNPDSNSQHPSLLQDSFFQSLIQEARSHNPSHRPNLLPIVLHLQQAVARYFLYRSKLPLPAPASLSASLSLYMPRTPVKTPSPIPADDIPDHFASGKPSPSRPAGPSYPHHLPPLRTTTVDLTLNTAAKSRPSRYCQPAPASPSLSSSSPLDMFVAAASRAHHSPSLSSLASPRYARTQHANPRGDLGLCDQSLSLPSCAALAPRNWRVGRASQALQDEPLDRPSGCDWDV